MMTKYSIPRCERVNSRSGAVNIDSVAPINLATGVVRAESTVGGFNNGADPVVTLDDGTALDVAEVSNMTIVANVPAGTQSGDRELAASTGTQIEQNASTQNGLGGTLSVVCND